MARRLQLLVPMEGAIALPAVEVKEEVLLDLEKLIDRYVSRETNGCLRWTGTFNNRGLPIVRVNGKGRRKVGGFCRAATRVQYIRHHGPIPPGKVIGWSCGNRWCLEPDHLRLKEKTWTWADHFMPIPGSTKTSWVSPRNHSRKKP